ncbi:MAG TPA: hypothetical protein VGQ08_13415 [Nitrospiraceae bacterium]|nr:hypothetical protein [Nitrospiraceae bacterium]
MSPASRTCRKFGEFLSILVRSACHGFDLSMQITELAVVHLYAIVEVECDPLVGMRIGATKDR